MDLTTLDVWCKILTSPLRTAFVIRQAGGSTMTKTVKLTKTEAEVLRDAARHPKGRVYVQDWSRASHKWGGKGEGGGRRYHAAMCKLRDKGLLDGYRSSSNNGPSPLGFITIYSTEAVAFITESGRQAIR